MQRLSTSRLWLVAALLIAPYIGLCFPSLYARATPSLFGFPFFYWYQFVWVVLTSILLWFVYRILRASETSHEQQPPR